MRPKTIEELTDIPVYDLGDIMLRPVVYEDYADMFDYGRDDEVTKTLVWDTYDDVEDAKNAINNVFLNRPQKELPAAYAIIDKQVHKMIGTCDFFRVDWEDEIGEIGYVLNRSYWNKGYMTKACQSVCAFGFDYLGLKKIEIRHLAENIGSKRVIEKCGFRYIGDVYFKSFDKKIPSYELTVEEFRQLHTI